MPFRVPLAGRLGSAWKRYELPFVSAGTGDYAAPLLTTGEALDQSSVTATNIIIASPILFGRPVTVHQLVVNVVTAQAGAQARLGIYRERGFGDAYPARLVLDAGTVDCSSTGGKILEMRADLEGGVLYWLAVHHNNGSLGLKRWHWRCARPDVLGANGDVLGRWIVGLHKTLGSFGALPDPFPSDATKGETEAITGDASLPTVAARVAESA